MLNPETPKILNYLMEKQHYGFEESYRLMMNLMENQFFLPLKLELFFVLTAKKVKHHKKLLDLLLP